ncbi:MAG: chromosomal replication initiator protein DnaA [Candidatus Vogelbacteria bacterium]|nr:chromosomal replication initiator protein DnaA [Candidatus Vogelbacteria bacterium]
MLDNKKLWDDAIIEIELGISRANFSTWFKNTHITRQEDGVVYLSVPSAFVKDWLLNKYHKFIMKAVRNISPNIRGIEYIIQKEGDREKENKQQQIQKPLINNQLKLNELYINKEDNLNPKYVFDSFIVGSFNELAHAASQAVIKNLGTTYNPLYIYGGSGLGKTHLIQSIGNYIKNVAGKKVFYLTSDKYGSEFVDSIRNNSVHLFKEKYKKYDLLIMDDIQFFSQKDKFQEELFHLFNSLYENNKQVVFSSDKPPRQISNLEDRLRSRFEGGMVIEVSKPEYESRVAILRSKLKMGGFYLPDETVEFIAANISDNIRELEGILNTIICQSQLKNKELSINEIKQLVKNSSKQKKTVSIKDVIKAVCDFYNIDEKTLYEKTRRKEVVKPRQIAMYILRQDFNTSYPYIGQKLGGRDHTTVIHACEKIKNDIKNSPAIEQEIEHIKNVIYSGQAVAGAAICDDQI